MTIWIDAQFSPAIATWISDNFEVDALALRDIGLRDAEDQEIFAAAKTADVIVMTKDVDFVNLLRRLGTPPRILWVTCGNTSNPRLKEILAKNIEQVLEMFKEGEELVEIGDL